MIIRHIASVRINEDYYVFITFYLVYELRSPVSLMLGAKGVKKRKEKRK